MSERILREQLAAWNGKPVLRKLYTDWFRRIKSWLPEGPTLEVGAGIGKLKEFVPGIATLDIEPTPWTDLAGDAQCLPVKDGALAGLVLFDVLHHLPHPVRFFHEAFRALRPGGRVVIMEPYVSALSYPVYRFLHPEKVDTGCNPYDAENELCSDTPFDSNQAVATVMFYRRPERFASQFPGFSIAVRERLALLGYPLTGGFGGRALAPDWLIERIADCEERCAFLAPLMAFRTFIVLEKHES